MVKREGRKPVYLAIIRSISSHNKHEFEMTKISTRHLTALPDVEILQRLCKSLATLDAVICREWEYRYYSYSNDWDKVKQEELFEMRDGSGDEFQILFSRHGAIINGLAHESEMSIWIEKEIEPVTFKDKLDKFFGLTKKTVEQQIWEGITDTIPDEFRGFIFSEPIRGTTFCIWRRTSDESWNIGNIQFPNNEYGDGSEDLLYILDNNPSTYQKWATEYYDEQFDTYELPLDLVKHIYDLKPLTKEIALILNPNIDDFDQLKIDLNQIGYQYDGL